MICKITKRSFNPLCYRFLLSILLKIRGGAGEMLYLHSTKREVQLIQNSCVSAGAAANGLGTQVNCGQGRTGEDCAG